MTASLKRNFYGAMVQQRIRSSKTETILSSQKPENKREN